MLALVAVLVAVLASVDGARGAAIGTAAVEVVGAVGGGVLLVRGRPHLTPSLSIVAKVALAALLAATPALITDLSVLMRTTLAAVIYGLMLLLLKALPRELLALLPARLDRSKG
jgi:Na+-driven multidrug efflux pump